MKSRSHRVIADAVSSALLKQGAGVNADLFRKGSVLPDFHFFWRCFSHRKRHLMDDVCLQLNYLRRLIDSGGNEGEISLRLGIASHFLCDFFTAPHNFWKKAEIVSHLKYESALDRYIWENASSIQADCLSFSLTAPEAGFDIRAFIEESHQAYLSAPRSFDSDARFSVFVLSSVCFSLFGFGGELVCPHRSSPGLSAGRLEPEEKEALAKGCERLERTYLGRKIASACHQGSEPPGLAWKSAAFIASWLGKKG